MRPLGPGRSIDRCGATALKAGNATRERSCGASAPHNNYRSLKALELKSARPGTTLSPLTPRHCSGLQMSHRRPLVMMAREAGRYRQNYAAGSPMEGFIYTPGGVSLFGTTLEAVPAGSFKPCFESR